MLVFTVQALRGVAAFKLSYKLAKQNVALRQNKMMTLTQFSRIAKALADPRRFEILEAIASADELACSALVEQFPICQATVSHHIKELANADLIVVRREGQHCYYQFCPEVLGEYIAQLQRRTIGKQLQAAKPEAIAR